MLLSTPWSVFIFGEDDKIVIACNTAHLLVPELERRLGVRFISLTRNTVAEITRLGLHRIGLLASPTTIHTRLYENALQVKDIEVILPSPVKQQKIEHIIRDVIAGRPHKQLQAGLQPIMRDLERSGAEAVLLGCTELSVLFPGESAMRIDPLHIIVKKLVKEIS